MDFSEKINKRLILGLAIVALFGTVTNYVYFSPILTLLIPLCIFVFNKKYLQRPIVWLYIFTAAFVISTALYDWHSLFSFEYYRRDGNFIIAYAPLLVLPLFSFEFSLKKLVRYFYISVLLLYLPIIIYHYLTLQHFSHVIQIVFHGLFIATNAAGGFLAVVAGLGFSYAYHRRNKKEFSFFLIIFLMLLTTYSRGSILGFLMGVIAWYFAITRRFKILLAVIAVPVILTVGAVIVGYPSYKNAINKHDEVNQHFEDVSGKTANILIRVMYLYPQAYYLFSYSPIVGTGVGSFDDRPIKLEKVMPLVYYNAQPNKIHTDRHAHHSYLMILAEQGIFGLALFLTFWISLFGYLMRIRGVPILRDFLLIAYFTLTFAAFTEHRITTPSNMLPFTIAMGLFLAQKKNIQTYIIEKIQG